MLPFGECLLVRLRWWYCLQWEHVYWRVRCMCHVSHTLSYELPPAWCYGIRHCTPPPRGVCRQDGIQQLGMHIDLTEPRSPLVVRSKESSALFSTAHRRDTILLIETRYGVPYGRSFWKEIKCVMYINHVVRGKRGVGSPPMSYVYLDSLYVTLNHHQCWYSHVSKLYSQPSQRYLLYTNRFTMYQVVMVPAITLSYFCLLSFSHPPQVYWSHCFTTASTLIVCNRSCCE